MSTIDDLLEEHRIKKLSGAQIATLQETISQKVDIGLQSCKSFAEMVMGENAAPSASTSATPPPDDRDAAFKLAALSQRGIA